MRPCGSNTGSFGGMPMRVPCTSGIIYTFANIGIKK
jgi:hypothetical protein